MKRFLPIIYTIIAFILGLASCIEDGFTYDAANQPVFSVDTLNLGTIITDQPSTTASFTIKNPHSKGLIISDINISGDDAQNFRINVDGIPASNFSDVEIRAKDSIFVFVEATIPATTSKELVISQAKINFVTNTIHSSVVLTASGQNVKRINGETLTDNTIFTADIPYLITDSLVVAPTATLTLNPGTTLLFHDNAMMIVRGTLIADGTPEDEINLTGDRTGNVVADISFDIMSRQWIGMFFTTTSENSRLTSTNIRNTSQGLTISGNEEHTPDITFINCWLHNSAGLTLEAVHANVAAYGSVFSEAAEGLVWLHGGNATFNHCTFANNYLFSAITGAAINISHLNESAGGLDDESGLPFLNADFSNCIIYGLGSDLSIADLTDTQVTFRNSLFRSEGENDDFFIDCLWNEDPLYYTIRSDYFFDYRIQDESPAIGTANPELTAPEAAVDAYGLARGETPDLGAYVYTPQSEETNSYN